LSSELRQFDKALNGKYALRQWQGFRVLGVDGSTGRLPKDDEIQAVYGGPKDADSPIARFSRLYDVLNKSVVHLEMVQI
jgi:hypothetical protein